MDNALFDARCAKLKTGEYLNDPSVFEYAENAMYEWRRLYDSLRVCCALQSQKIEMLRKINSTLEQQLRTARTRVTELERVVRLIAKEEVAADDL